MIFGKGRVARHKEFTIEGKPLEEVKSYTYLGFKFSPQLSFSDHLSMVNTKARSRIGLLFNRIPLRSLQLEVVLKIFDVYVLPIYRYGCFLFFIHWQEILYNSSFFTVHVDLSLPRLLQLSLLVGHPSKSQGQDDDVFSVFGYQICLS